VPKKDDKKATHLTKYFDLNYIVETIYYNKVPKYAVMNGKGPEILDFVKPNDNLWLKPYTDPFGNLDKGSILLPTAILDYGTTDKLLDEIRDFISTYCYLPDFWLELSSYYALMTWVYDAFTSVPYLEFLGDKDSGKTRIAKCIAECSYNSIKMSGAGSIPALFRLVDRFRGSLFIDEADYKDSEFDSAIAKIVNSGYTRDGVVWRCDVFEKDYEPRAYSVYGPKILSHREQYKDDATGSRCISFIVPKNSDIPKSIPPQLPPEFAIQGETIRNKALKWRFDNLRSLKPDLTLGSELQSRYREIAIPLLNLIKNNKFKKTLIEFIAASSKEAKDDSELSICVIALRKLLKNEGKYMRIKDIADEIAAEYTKLGDTRTVTPKNAGHMVHLLGIDTKRVMDGYRVELTPETKKKLEKIFADYPGYELEV